SFCQARSINHFFCELPTLLQLSCSNTSTNDVLQVYHTVLNTVGPLLMILVSYIYILHTVLQIPLATRRLKVFSTCASHLVAITIFYAPGILTYVQPHEASSWDQAKLVSVCYCILTPTLNPLIYSLRNKEVKGALHDGWKKVNVIIKESTRTGAALVPSGIKKQIPQEAVIRQSKDRRVTMSSQPRAAEKAGLEITLVESTLRRLPHL
ncbi:olfactory receptor 10A3-like, partial [Pezoporus flaviventris]|uniref:olfactory receptor 10A3-like n=1 Tax=Pezoporus flaviventris TaxID=889875 RepID=UPI002AAFA50F